MRTFSLAKRANYTFLAIVVLAVVVPLSVQFYKNASIASEEKVRALKLASEYSSKSLSEALLTNQLALSAQQVVGLCVELRLIACELLDAHDRQIYMHQNVWTHSSVATYTHVFMFNGKLVGKIRYTYESPTFASYFLAEAHQLILITLFFLFLAYLCFQFFLKYPLAKFQTISAAMKKEGLDEAIANFDQIDSSVEEIRDLKEAIKDKLILIKGYERNRQKEAELGVMRDITRQVAHDIKSPLLALSVATQSLDTLPEEIRVLIRSAVGRIKDISNDLSRQSVVDMHIGDQPILDESSNRILSAIVEEIVSEKRAEYKSRNDILIECCFNENSYGHFANVHPAELKRIISNIINNSVEAIETNGTVKVFLDNDESGYVLITVQDNGCGFPQTIKQSGIKKGLSSGKSTGSGLGLYHAKKTVEGWGGQLILETGIPNVTSVVIKLKKVSEPDWFVPRLSTRNLEEVIVVDDDDTIHHVWDMRFSSIGFPFQIKHFFDPMSLLQSKVTSEHAEKKLFLIDYEFVTTSMNGLDLIEQLGIAKSAILVTSRYEEVEVQSRCNSLGVKLLPKILSEIIPIPNYTKQRSDALSVQI